MQAKGSGPVFRRILVRSCLPLKTLRRNIPDHALSVIFCCNGDPLRWDREHSRWDRVHVVTPGIRFHHIPWSPGCRVSLWGSFQHTCHPPATGRTRPPQDQTPAVYFPGKIRHDGHVTAVGTPDVLQDTLLEVWRDGFPE
jgi:hypothetical protein